MLKEKRLEDERLKLSEIASELNKQKTALLRAQNELDNLKKDFDNLKFDNNNGIDSGFIINYSLYIQKTESEIRILENKMKEIQQRFNGQNEQVKKAYIELKTLEKLKEKQLICYKNELLKEEMKFIDDIVTSKRKLRA